MTNAASNPSPLSFYHNQKTGEANKKYSLGGVILPNLSNSNGHPASNKRQLRLGAIPSLIVPRTAEAEVDGIVFSKDPLLTDPVAHSEPEDQDIDQDITLDPASGITTIRVLPKRVNQSSKPLIRNYQNPPSMGRVLLTNFYSCQRAKNWYTA